MDPRVRTWAVCVCMGSALLVGCDETTAPPPSGAPSGVAPGAKATAASSADTKAAKAEPEPVCTTVVKKVWAKHVNTRTGLTASRFSDGRVALGVAVGDSPHALWFDAKGEGKLVRTVLADETELAKQLKPEEGSRHLQRVTVSSANVLADYRDKYKDGHRRIACGPTARVAPYLVFDGNPLLQDVDDTGKDRKAAIDAAAAGSAAPVASAEPSPEAPEAPAGDKRELRDCRSFSDPEGKDVWAAGSELVGEQKGDETHWSMRFFVMVEGGKAERVNLHAEALGTSPKKLHTLEAPVGHRLADGSHVIAGRYRDRMFAWILSKDKRVVSALHKYGGGYPSLPRVLEDGDDHMLLTSQKVDLSKWKLRALRLRKGTPLMDALLIPKLGDEEESFAEPTFARIGDQRWLAYHDGERRGGRVHVIPVDADLGQQGREHAVTTKETTANESHLFAAGDKLLLVYISRPDGGKPAELVSELMSCKVQKQE